MTTRPLLLSELFAVCQESRLCSVLEHFPHDYLITGEAPAIVLLVAPDTQVVAHLPLAPGHDIWIDPDWQARDQVRRHLIGMPSIPSAMRPRLAQVTIVSGVVAPDTIVMIVPRPLTLGECMEIVGTPDYLALLHALPPNFQIGVDHQGAIVVADDDGDTIARINLYTGTFWEIAQWRDRLHQRDAARAAQRDMVTAQIAALRAAGHSSAAILRMVLETLL